MNLMKDFMASREKLTGDWRIKYVDSENLPYLKISDLPVLAGFTGYVKTRSRKIRKKVFYRGQTNDWNLIPSLFRDDDNIVLDAHRIAIRLSAYNELVKETKLKYKNVGRFQVENIDPILQHYGIRIPWIDLVDNIFVAIWFAIHKFEKDSNGISRCKPSSEKFGWIYYFQVSDDIKYYDLRENYISLSLRPHSQHGISATRRGHNWNLQNRSLNDFVCARVKFPVSDDLLKGQMFDPAFMFPNEKFDNTYKYLRYKKFSKLLQEIVNKSNLEEHELGQIDIYK